MINYFESRHDRRFNPVGSREGTDTASAHCTVPFHAEDDSGLLIGDIALNPALACPRFYARPAVRGS